VAPFLIAGEQTPQAAWVQSKRCYQVKVWTEAREELSSD